LAINYQHTVQLTYITLCS